MFAVWSQVTHLLPANKTNLDDYILLHPDAAKYIWFPDIYIGNFYNNQLFSGFGLSPTLSIYSQPKVEIKEYLCLRYEVSERTIYCYLL